MAKRFLKPSINWAEMEKVVPPDQKGKFMAFKTKADAYLRRVLANPPEPPPVNWEEYQKLVPIPGLVDKLKSQYEAFKVPFPTDTLSSQIDEQWKGLEGEIKTFCADMDKNIATANKELARLQALPKYEEMTMEMYSEMFPNEAIDPVSRPSFWPHDKEEQPGYVSPEQKAAKEGGKGH